MSYNACTKAISEEDNSLIAVVSFAMLCTGDNIIKLGD
jgi:hypothetical protein